LVLVIVSTTWRSSDFSALAPTLSLGLVALITGTLITHEIYRYAEARDRVRHGIA
jgi:hypothetical protein